MAPRKFHKAAVSPIAPQIVQVRRPGEIPPWRKITVREIASTDAMLIEYDDWMRLPFTQLLLGALEQAVKPVTPPFRGINPDEGLARHYYQCGNEDVIKLIRNIDQLKPRMEVGEPLYGADTIEEFVAQLQRTVDTSGAVIKQPEE